MRTFDQWMAEYGISHRNPTNMLIHKICVPLIMLSVIGLIFAIPTPVAFDHFAPYLNWASIFIVGCLAFYLSLNATMFVGMLILTSIMWWICSIFQQMGILVPSMIVIFVVSWIAQFYGHKVEGKKPSFLKDLAFLLIGPLWFLRFVYQKIGVKV